MAKRSHHGLGQTERKGEVKGKSLYSGMVYGIQEEAEEAVASFYKDYSTM